MTNPDADFRQSLVAAVQAELERHAAAVVAEVERVRTEAAAERAQLQREVQQQISALTQLVHQAQTQADSNLERVKGAFESRLLESETRNARRIDDVTAGIDGIVQAAARPVLQSVADDHQMMSARLDSLEQMLRRFDEQAARLVNFVSDAIRANETKQAELSQAVTADVESRVAALTHLVETNESNVRRFQNEVGQLVSSRLNDAEDRINTRLMAAEARMKEDAGARIAEVQAHVGRVDAHIDETLQIVNNRLAGFDERVLANDRRLEMVEERLAGVDREALDELANKMSAAVGEAMLVRIEMERAEKQLNERTDALAVRVTEVETQIQDVTMDVSTAVQLDRLEEVERLIAELDPNKFVLREGVQPISGLPDPNAQPRTASVDDDSYPVAPASIFGIVDPDVQPTLPTSDSLPSADEALDEKVDHGTA